MTSEERRPGARVGAAGAVAHETASGERVAHDAAPQKAEGGRARHV